MPVLEVTGAYNGRYEVREHRADGSLLIAPDTSITALRARHQSRATTPDEVTDLVGELPADSQP